MRAAIKGFYSTDVDVDAYVSEDPKNDSVWVRMICGPVDGPGEESFDVLLCTPGSLAAEAANGPVIGRHRLIQEELNVAAALRYLQEFVGQIDEPDWISTAEKLGRVGHWEFDDYRPYSAT